VEKQHAMESAVITYSSYVTKGSGVTAVGAGLSQRVAENPEVLTLSDIGVYVGMVGVVIGLSVNVIAQYRRDRREQELHRLQVAAFQDRCDEDTER